MYTGKNPRKKQFPVEGPININMFQLMIKMVASIDTSRQLRTFIGVGTRREQGEGQAPAIIWKGSNISYGFPPPPHNTPIFSFFFSRS